MSLATNTYYAIGVMSGSSLDGLDIAFCKLAVENGKWNYQIIAADCVSFSDDLKDSLRSSPLLTGKDLWHLHTSFGKYVGACVNSFISANAIAEKIDCIASHGHTVFHYPDKNFTTQIGDGAAIAAITGIATVCDLRAVDVALGGTGAPIVPIADKLLFSEYMYCLNLGGIANVTTQSENSIAAFDVCPCNQLLDFYAQQLGKNYDESGAFAAEGKVYEKQLQQLLSLDFHQKNAPKSLDNSFSKTYALPILGSIDGTPFDKLRTATEYIAVQISNDIKLPKGNEKLLVTGGGAFNTFLMGRLQSCLSDKIEVVVPDAEIVKFKEALAMALIGVLRLRGEVNVLQTVTSASRGSVNGALFFGKP